MILRLLTLQNFRSYVKKTCAFSASATLIVGANAAGKTNILEAISMLSVGKSFRADEEREVIRRGAEASSIKCQVSPREDSGQAEESTKLEMVVTAGIKKYLVNGVPRRQIDFVGHLRTVLFWPEHLELVTDSPSLRRRYLDSVLVQTDREYRRNLISYERGLRQRNKLLDLIREGSAERRQLVFWNQLLIKSGGYITDKRRQYIDFVNMYQVSGVKYHVQYDKSIISESRLAQYADAEIAAKATLVGPHRDDFAVLTNNQDLSKYGSRGEQRLAVLWLKMAELAYIERETGETPVLLLDDIFSELDTAHRRLVIALVERQQTVLTVANEDIMKLVSKESAVIRL